MGRKRAHTAYGEFRQLVERCRGGRSQLRPRFIPEMMAWLQLMSRGFEHAYTHVKNTDKSNIPGPLKASLEWYKTAVDVIRMIAVRLNSQFSTTDWNEVTAEVAKVFNIHQHSKAPGRSAADDLDDPVMEG